MSTLSRRSVFLQCSLSRTCTCFTRTDSELLTSYSKQTFSHLQPRFRVQCFSACTDRGVPCRILPLPFHNCCSAQPTTQPKPYSLGLFCHCGCLALLHTLNAANEDVSLTSVAPPTSTAVQPAPHCIHCPAPATVLGC